MSDIRDVYDRCRDIGRVLFNEPEDVEMTPELADEIIEATEEIHACPIRGRGRDFEHVLRCTLGMVIEHALAKRLGVVLNSSLRIAKGLPKFDRTDRESYAYDAIDLETGETFECKRHSDTYYSFDMQDIQTLIKNSDLVDLVVSASTVSDPTPYIVTSPTQRIVTLSSRYIVTFRSVADAKSFHKFIRRSKFPGGKEAYYDHFEAGRRGMAYYNTLKRREGRDDRVPAADIGSFLESD